MDAASGQRAGLLMIAATAPLVFALTAVVGLHLMRRGAAAVIVVQAGMIALVVAAVVLLGLWFYLHHRNQWRRPLVQLLRTVYEIRSGKAPIGQLAQVDGGLEPVAEILAEILRELREQKAKIAQIEAEMSQRVAQRTDALERVISSLRHQAVKDGLTGLLNRRMLDQHLPTLVDRCRAAGHDMATLMIDVDHFKHINDTLGHAAGDELLRTVGQLIRSTIREGDLPFRYGGDEFAIILPAQCARAAGNLAERLSSLVDAMGKTLRVTPSPRLSIGISSLSEMPSASAIELLGAADKRLYEIKAQHKAAESRTTTAA